MCLIFRHLIENDAHVDMVLHGRIGRVIPNKEGKDMVSSMLLTMSK